ncbi:hypothetical protein TorRG33x02_334480, partial [Trema orientale]
SNAIQFEWVSITRIRPTNANCGLLLKVIASSKLDRPRTPVVERYYCPTRAVEEHWGWPPDTRLTTTTNLTIIMCTQQGPGI